MLEEFWSLQGTSVWASQGPGTDLQPPERGSGPILQAAGHVTVQTRWSIQHQSVLPGHGFYSCGLCHPGIHFGLQLEARWPGPLRVKNSSQKLPPPRLPSVGFFFFFFFFVSLARINHCYLEVTDGPRRGSPSSPPPMKLYPTWSVESSLWPHCPFTPSHHPNMPDSQVT